MTAPHATDDHIAITRLHSAYADAVSRFAWNELDRLFRPDATLTVGRGASAAVVEGPGAIGELIRGATGHLVLLVFTVLNTVVEVDGDRARTRSFVSEVHITRDTGQRSDLFGVYHDGLVRVDGRWWFAERHWHRLARSGRGMEGAGLPEGFDDWLG